MPVAHQRPSGTTGTNRRWSPSSAHCCRANAQFVAILTALALVLVLVARASRGVTQLQQRVEGLQVLLPLHLNEAGVICCWNSWQQC